MDAEPNELEIILDDLIEQWEGRSKTARDLATKSSLNGDTETENRCNTKAGVINGMVRELRREMFRYKSGSQLEAIDCDRLDAICPSCGHAEITTKTYVIQKARQSGKMWNPRCTKCGVPYIAIKKHRAQPELKSKDKEARDLWDKLGEIPIDSDDNIESPFLHFPEGTHREEVWHWFEDEYNVRVYDLMYPNQNHDRHK